MIDTRFACQVCGTVFSERRARIGVVDPEEDGMQDEILCPNCGSARIEPDPFDPDAPVDNPLEAPDEEAYG
jgi:DNA-directed RNA polymerase subunit RPC12/RpoP